MSNTKKTFKKTGNNVTVSREDLIEVTIDRLMNYDSLTPTEKKKISNPYKNPVYTKVAGGKTVQVPRQIQHLAIVKWVSIKKRADMASPPLQTNDAHTRVKNRDRYAIRDPYVMNKELQIQGDSDFYDNEDPSDYELSSSRHELSANRRAVGQTNVPDFRYGRGGTQGDLPRDMVDFAALMERDIQDMPYETNNVNNKRVGHVMPYEGKYLYDRDAPDRSHAYLDDQLEMNKKAVRSRPSQYGRYNPVVDVDDLKTLDAGVLAEKNTCESEGVEHYAPVNEKYYLDKEEEIVDYSTNDCNSCKGADDGFVYREQVLDEENNGDQYIDDDAEYDENLDGQDYLDIDQAEPVTDVRGRDADHIENYDNEYYGQGDCTFKHLFLLLLVIVIIYVVYKKRNGEPLWN
jgi:hypothetical protein